MNILYSNLLHERARKWGLSVQKDRPLINDATSPYPKLDIAEILSWHGDRAWKYAEISLVTLNGMWSYAVHFSVSERGGGFGPCLKFCDPVTTRDEALTGAIAWLRGRNAAKDQELAAWLVTIGQPQQLALFQGV